MGITAEGGGEGAGLVVSFGEMLIDFVPDVAGVSLAESTGFLKAPGGAPANVAVAISKLGGRSAFVGKVPSPSLSLSLSCSCGSDPSRLNPDPLRNWSLNYWWKNNFRNNLLFFLFEINKIILILGGKKEKFLWVGFWVSELEFSVASESDKEGWHKQRLSGFGASLDHEPDNFF